MTQLKISGGTQLEIISGTSFFGPNKVVGIALKGDNDCSSATKWAERVCRTGRPATVMALNGREHDATVLALRDRWLEWADRNDIQITISNNVRRVRSRF